MDEKNAREISAKEVLKRRPELFWLDYENIKIEDASKGAGGIRQVGRFLLVDKAAQPYDKIRSVIQGALVDKSKLNVHICSGISGGTGSGTFLDICYLVRAILKDIGKEEANVFGYFFLPDVNLSVPEALANALRSRYIKVNGYAALKELDYCMNFDKNQDGYNMNYGFKMVNPTLLAERIKDEIISGKLAANSTPLFWQNAMYHNPVGMKSTLTVPYDATDIKAAAQLYRSGKSEFTVRESCVTDKISMMRFYSGLPMFAYQGIMELQREYEQDKLPGRHLYERGEIDWNKYLPSPIPYSFAIDLPIKRIVNRNKALLEEFREAEAMGVAVSAERGYWEIMETESLDVDEFIARQGGYEVQGKIDLNKVVAITKALEEKVNAIRTNAVPRRIESGNPVQGSERHVMLDFYLASPVLNKLVGEELRKRKDHDARLDGLKSMAENVGGEVREKREFFNAIFTGVITSGGR
jgi:hypothetical protein